MWAYPVYKTLILYNICTMSKLLDWRCTNVIQMFCVCWVIHWWLACWLRLWTLGWCAQILTAVYFSFCCCFYTELHNHTHAYTLTQCRVHIRTWDTVLWSQVSYYYYKWMGVPVISIWKENFSVHLLPSAFNDWSACNLSSLSLGISR